MRHHSPDEYQGVDYRSLGKTCPSCMRNFNTYSERDTHQYRERHFGPFQLSCYYCHRRFITKVELDAHLSNNHFGNYAVTQSRLQGSVEVLSRTFKPGQIPNAEMLALSETPIWHALLDMYLNKWFNLSCHVVAWGNFVKYSSTGQVVDVQNMPLTTARQHYQAFTRGLIDRKISRHMRDIGERADAVETRGSGWSLTSIMGVGLHLYKRRLAGSCSSDAAAKKAMKHLSAKEKSCLVDVRSPWPKGCFWTSVAQSYLCAEGGEVDEASQPARTLLFLEQFVHRGRFVGTEVFTDDIAEIEKLNSHGLNFAVNVYVHARRAEAGAAAGTLKQSGNRTNIFIPAYISERKKNAKKIVNLLLVGDYRKPELMHFVYIKDLTKLLLSSSKRSMYRVCEYCLNSAPIQTFDQHVEACKVGGQQIEMPQPDADGTPPRLEFKPGRKRFYNPCVGFLDFESANTYRRPHPNECDELDVEDEEEVLPEKIEVLEGEELLNFMASGLSSTNVVATQTPITYALVFVGGEEGFHLGTRVRSSDKKLLQLLMDDLEDCHEVLQPYFNDVTVCPGLTLEEQQEFDAATKCWICERDFDDNEWALTKCRDHAHSSFFGGRYIGAACVSCNSGRQHARYIPIMVHNLDKYDGCFLLHAMMKHAWEADWPISGIPQNTQRFLSLSIGPFKFLDSLHFLKGSLTKLVDNALEAGERFDLIRDFSRFRLDGRQHTDDYLLRKGVYPYRSALSARQLRQQKSLPGRDSFYSDLEERDVSDEDYAFAVAFWNVSGVSNMLEYTEVYCLLDTLLLASCVMQYRKQVYQEFKLDMTQFLSGPQLAFNAMLLSTRGQRVDLLTDIEMYNMLRRGLRGGVSHASLRHAENSSDNALVILDAVNLYGWSLMQRLPAHSYEWLEEEELASMDWTTLDGEDDETGYVVECDLDYPPHLHESHCSFPLAPEQLTITEDMLSPYAKHCRNLLADGSPHPPKFVPEKKLGATFQARKKYIVYSRTLSFYLKMGLELKKVHRAFKFVQTSWIADYVRKMTSKRAASKTTFEKALYKVVFL